MCKGAPSSSALWEQKAMCIQRVELATDYTAYVEYSDTPMPKKTLTYVSHEASRTGAPLFLYNALSRMNPIDWDQQVLLLRDGSLKKSFADLHPTRVYKEFWWKALCHTKKTPDLYYLNSHSYSFLHQAQQEGVPALCHVHEVPLSFAHESPETLELLRTYPLSYLAVSRYVENMLVSMGIERKKIRYCPSGIDVVHWKRRSSGEKLRHKIGIPSDAIVIGMSGQVVSLKGVDIWIEMAKMLTKNHPEKKWHFVWVGGVSKYEPDYLQMMQQEVQDAGLSQCIHFVGEQRDPRSYYEVFDIFTLTSRMESLSLVCLENAMMGTPVIAFSAAGGPQEFGNHGFVELVQDMNAQFMVNAVLSMHEDLKRQRELQEKAAIIIPQMYSIDTSVSTMKDEIQRVFSDVQLLKMHCDEY